MEESVQLEIVESLRDNNISNLKRLVDENRDNGFEMFYQLSKIDKSNISNELLEFLIEIADNEDLLELSYQLIKGNRYDLFERVYPLIKPFPYEYSGINLLSILADRGYV